MPGTKISALPAATYATLGDVFPIVQSGATKKFGVPVISQALTLNVPGTYADIPTALAAIAPYRLAAPVTIQLAAGYLLDATSLAPTHPDGAQITIQGAAPVSMTITSLGAVSGSAGAWSVTINVNSTAGVTVNDFCIIPAVAGSGNITNLQGCWKITGKTSTSVTVTNTNGNSVFPTTTLNNGTILDLPSGIIAPVTGGSAIHLDGGYTLGGLVNLALVGRDTGAQWGLLVTGGSSFAGTVTNVGIGGGLNGTGVAVDTISACGGDFIIGGFVEGVHVYGKFQGSVIVSGCRDCGLLAFSGGNVYAPNSRASGCTKGVLSYLGSRMDVSGSYVADNVSIGIRADEMSYIRATTVGDSPTFSPSPNTVGNSNSFITA